MSAPVPVLSESRWVNNPAEKADQLASYYFVAEASQTHLYPGGVVSLPAQVQAYGHDEHQIRSKVRDDLQRYFSPYFEAVNVEVTTDIPNPQDPNRINITVNCTVVDKGETYSLSRLISTVNSKIVGIVDINNNQGA